MVFVLTKPPSVFDREWEWGSLASFVLDDSPEATLGLVTGRRRQGKSLLLEEVCAATGGFYFAATQATEAETLRLLGETIALYLGSPAPLLLPSWEAAIDVLLDLGSDQQVVVALDEFPYLVDASPALPSIIQRALGPRRPGRLNSRSRIILCGSALSFMHNLVSGSSPLRGRSGLELSVHAFDFRMAAQFWEIEDPRLALRVNAVVGGTPAYRREYVRGDSPRRLNDFDAWVTRTILNPASPLFKESRYLLAEDGDFRRLSIYHSVLAAIAEGHHTRGGIARFTGRREDTLSHPLDVLADSGLVARDEDAFRSSRAKYRITEPVIRFYHAIMRPEWARLERPGRAADVWMDSQDRFRSNILGPHFEELCRSWVRDFAPSDAFGGRVVEVGSGLIHNQVQRRNHQVDVAVLGEKSMVLSIGEAKYCERMSISHLRRLQGIAKLLPETGRSIATDLRLALYSGVGFTSELSRLAAANGSIVLVDLNRLYGRSAS